MGLASNFFVLCTIMYIVTHKRWSLALPGPVVKVIGSIDFLYMQRVLPLLTMQSSGKLLYLVAALINYPPTKSEGYSFGVVCASFRSSVCPHFLSVRNHISVPISQI